MGKRKSVQQQRRQKPMAGSDSGVTRQIFAKPKGRRIPKGFISAPPDLRGA
jgi:hypothetical protein